MQLRNIYFISESKVFWLLLFFSLAVHFIILRQRFQMKNLIFFLTLWLTPSATGGGRVVKNFFRRINKSQNVKKEMFYV